MTTPAQINPMPSDDSSIVPPADQLPTKEKIIEAMKRVIDPELYLDIWTLGLIYDIKIEEGKLDIEMTFTSIACPSGPQLVEEVRTRSLEVPGIKEANVKVVFTPPWQPSEDLKALLGIA